MKPYILIGLCLALVLVEVRAEADNAVGRGIYPFMAFIYYPDETVVDSTGSRFVRGAVLIRSGWLVSSAIGPNIVNGFPRKTLLARVGAITIDSNFTLNEDEYEQEREVIQIVRPFNHSATQWWRTDISLMKTLLPFNLSSAVAIATINPKHDNMEKSCIILVYIRKFGNWTEDKLLMQMSVDLLPPSVTNCGNHFTENTMACAADSDDNKQAANNPKFCEGNSGGPLICEGDVIGLQTYINNDCKQPHLYQLLAAWDNFISCGTEEKCEEEECGHICDIANKDSPSSEVVTPIQGIVKQMSYQYTIIPNATTTEPITTTETNENATTYSSTMFELLRSELLMTSAKPSHTITKEQPNKTVKITSTTTTTDAAQAESDMDTAEAWPKQKDVNKKLNEGYHDKLGRKPSVEAQRHDGKAKMHSTAPSNVVKFQTIFVAFFITACLI